MKGAKLPRVIRHWSDSWKARTLGTDLRVVLHLTLFESITFSPWFLSKLLGYTFFDRCFEWHPIRDGLSLWWKYLVSKKYGIHGGYLDSNQFLVKFVYVTVFSDVILLVESSITISFGLIPDLDMSSWATDLSLPTFDSLLTAPSSTQTVLMEVFF